MNKKVSIIAFVVMIIILTTCITCVGYALGVILVDNLSGSIRYSMSWAIIVAAIINCVAAFGIYCASCELKDIIDK
ncbi:hypothetical protein [Rudgehvirus jaberico]|jgi:hypothetical protein|uniref:Uncharacterized protein n=1 Tax=Caudoviricetes sp. 'Rudgehvirus jaberico' TaxID=3028515 RepID=A0AAF0D5H9_9CAUD|nr:hypothetical protein [Caudoviricetes sp. 'Rudgehvirus jaberico']